MFLPTLLVLFPAAALAARLPFMPRQAANGDNCTSTTTLPPVTFTSLSPTSTLGGQSPSVSGGSGSLIYTTAFPTLGNDGLGVHTYTVTIPCPGTTGSPCRPLGPGECPPGFTTSAVACSACGSSVVTTVLTLPVETPVGSEGPISHPTYTKVDGETPHVTQTGHASEGLSTSTVSSGVPASAATNSPSGSGSGFESKSSGSHSSQQTSGGFSSDSQSSDVSSPTSTNVSSGLGSVSPGSGSLTTQSVESVPPQSTAISSEGSGDDSEDGQGDSGSSSTLSVQDTFTTIGSSSTSSEETAAATPSAIQAAGSAPMLANMETLLVAFSVSCALAQLGFFF
ncbi:hypothetical protein AK830_g2142 [Neonectria ditissima]|uniref:REJ domain-containing protein n=1 Tax=Neonectria ditissima TaxID=78410 RepID=A0A0P7BX11_9HYPO|nr:hypothetical protein AK830_g2142 [Neonectria ditissima]